jgi:hypothetical protein
MAIVGLNNLVGVKINSIDLSDHVTNVSLLRQFDELEISAMGDYAHRYTKGLESSTLQLDFLSDESAASVNATLSAAWGTTVPFTLLQNKSAAVSATNPLITGTILVNKTQDINGAVGDIAKQSITFTVNGQTTIATSGTF